jgi:3-oxoadipate enol-lactonase
MPLAKVNGINIDYTVAGQGDPLIMIMGMGFGQKGWVFQTGYFKKYFQVITFDNRGCGNSDKPEGLYSTRMMAEDLIGLMDYLHLNKAHVLGLSMGGMIAQELAINYPQRVNKLVLVSTFCKNHKDISGDTPEWTEAVNQSLKGTPGPMINLLLNKRFNRMIYTPIMKRAQKKAGAAGAAGLIGQRQACVNHYTADRLIKIAAPTLVIGGSEDKVLYPNSSKVISNLIPGSRLLLINKGSHLIPLEMKARFNKEVLDFLKSP